MWMSDNLEHNNPVLIDAHCHMRPRRGGVVLTPHFIIDNMDAAGVDMIVSLGGGGNPLKSLKENNDFNIQAARDYPERIIPFIYFDPRYEEDGLEEIDRCMEKAGDVIKGVKVGHQFAVARYMYPMMEKAQEYGLPVGIHSDCKVTGHPYIIGDLANSFPKVSTIILHMGGRTSAAAEMLSIKMAEKNANVWLETSFSNPYPIKKAVEILGPDRIMFGSDSSNAPSGYGGGFERQAYNILIHSHSIRCLGLPKDHEDKLMGLNAARLFNLEVGNL
jgi:predicted TIM-barrel fold metal-dependent hydrolase